MIKRGPILAMSLPFMLLVASCSSVDLKEAGTLSSYDRLGVSRGKFTKSRTYVDAEGLSTVKTVAIQPAAFAAVAASRVGSVQDRLLVTKALDRAVCVALSDKFVVVAPGQHADLTIRAVVTDIVVTNKAMAGVSTAVSLGSSAVLPVGIPRLPAGLGGLAVEAEAIDREGSQRAAVVWSKGANSITNNARVSEVGDAYSLAADFGNHFARMIIIGKEPKGFQLSLPSGQRVKSVLGGKPKYVACDAFGRAPGVIGMVADKVGAPPGWTDKSAKATAQ